MASVQTIPPKTKRSTKVPEYLIKEVLDGLPVNYIPVYLEKEGIPLE
ncbi:MAG: hypothetical protein U0X91_16480 [Spirosomataceae bacterium]